MNDRYLFRGKVIRDYPTDNLWQGDWVKGSLFGAAPCILKLDLITKPFLFAQYHIDSQTIGQCTGLKDKNDKLIFDGDVIERNKSYFIVIWNKEELFWEAKSIPKEDCIKYFNLFLSEVPFCEIIGNRWDNPELLEEI